MGALCFILGAAKLGCAVAPAEKELKSSEIKRLIELYQPSAALVPELIEFQDQSSAVFSHASWAATLQTRAAEGRSPTHEAIVMDGEENALFVLTSGTTGCPKSVLVSVHRLQQMAQSVVSPEMSMVYFGSPAWISFSAMFTSTLSVKGTLILGQLYNKDLYFSALLRHKPSYCFFWPEVIVDFVNEDTETQESVASFCKNLSYGGAKTPIPSLIKLLSALPNTNIKQFYASSETGVVASLGEEEHQKVRENPSDAEAIRRLGSAGVPISYKIRVVGEGTTVPLPTGEVGSIQCEFSFDGYLRNPEKTAEKVTEDGWFITGDLGYLDEDGFLFLSGRDSETIVLINGANVTCSEVENCISELKGVVEVAVAPVTADDGSNEVGAFVCIAQKGAIPTVADVRAHCKSRLGQEKFQPTHVFLLDKRLPRNNNGKCLKQCLAAMVTRPRKLVASRLSSAQAA